MTISSRVGLSDFALANPLYAGATVTILEVDPATLVPTGNLAPVYADLVGAGTLGNPQALDGNGKWQQPVYVDRPVLMRVGTAEGETADTGVLGPIGQFRGTWAPQIAYMPGDTVTDGAAGNNTASIYYCAVPHTSGSFAADVAVGLWLIYVDVGSVVSAADAARIDAEDAAVDASSSASASAASASAAAASAAAAAGTPRRNVLVNGAMGIWQRGSPRTSFNEYVADRWDTVSDHSGGTLSAAQTLVTDQEILDAGLRYYLRYAVSGGPTGGTVHQLINRTEGAQTLAGTTATLSFWAWADAPITVGLTLTQNFGTGGSPSGSVSVGITPVNLTTTPRRFIRTIAIPSIFGKTIGTNFDDRLGLAFSLPVNANFVFNLTGVQLEKSDTVTDFDLIPGPLEILLCERFYQTGVVHVVGYQVAGEPQVQNYPLRTYMRRFPDVTLTGVVEGNCSGSSVDASSNTLVVNVGNATVTGTAGFFANYALDAEFT